MEYIVVFMLGALASSKMTFQSAFGKERVKNSTDALCFNVFVFVTAALIFLPWVFGCSYEVWLYASVAAAFTVAYQMFYIKALSFGNVSLTVLTVNSGVIINILISKFFFDEPVSFIRFIAIVMILISLVTCHGTLRMKDNERRWLIYALLATVSNSCASIALKFFGESPFSGENKAYISCLYILAAVIGIVGFLLMKSKEKLNFKIKRRVIKYSVAAGVSLALYQLFFTYGLAHIDGTFLFPAQTGATMIFSTLSGVLIFKDKFTKRQVFGLILGVVSLVIMNY